MPSSEQIHPEFGYLAPTAPVRRNLRVALVAGVVGLLFGGASVLALTARPKPEVAKLESTLAFAPIDEIASTPPAGSPGPAARLAPEPGAPGPAAGLAPPPGEVAKPCKDQVWPYLGSNCLSSKETRRWRHVRVLPPDAPAQAAPVKAADVIAEATKPPEPSAMIEKKRKTANKSRRKRGREREQDDAGSAYASPYQSRQEPWRRNEARQESWGRDESRQESRRRGERRQAPWRGDYNWSW